MCYTHQAMFMVMMQMSTMGMIATDATAAGEAAKQRFYPQPWPRPSP